MVLRPVELDATGDPRAGEPHEGGLNDVLAIEEVVAGALVQPDVNAATELWQHHEPQELIFDVHCLPLPRLRFGRHGVDNGQRIDAAIATLVDALLEEQRIWIRS